MALQEYDIEIKPTNIVKGQGFCRMLAGASNMSETQHSSDKVKIYEYNMLI